MSWWNLFQVISNQINTKYILSIKSRRNWSPQSKTLTMNDDDDDDEKGFVSNSELLKWEKKTEAYTGNKMQKKNCRIFYNHHECDEWMGGKIKIKNLYPVVYIKIKVLVFII